MANWRRTVNIKDLLTDDDSPAECKRVAQAMAARLRGKFSEPGDELLDIIESFEGLEATDNRPLAVLNDILDNLYDWADAERIWLGL